MPATTIVLDNSFLAAGWGNGAAIGNPTAFLDSMIAFYRRHGYEIVTNNIIESEFLSDLLPSEIQAARTAWWESMVNDGDIRVDPVANIDFYSGSDGGERSLLQETIPNLAQDGDVSHVRLFATDDFLRSEFYRDFLDGHPEVSRTGFVQDWAGNLSDRIRLGDQAASSQLDQWHQARIVTNDHGVNRGLILDADGRFSGSVTDAIEAHWDVVNRFGDAQAQLELQYGAAEYSHFSNLPDTHVRTWFRVAGEAVGAGLILLDAYTTRQAIAEAMLRGDLGLADELLGGLIGRSFGGAFLAAVAGGATSGLWGGIPGAIIGGILGAIGGGAIGEWLFGALGDLGFHASELLDDLADLLRDIMSDPIVLDLDGDGLELISLTSSTTFFDLDDDGVIERTGWVQPHDGLLVHDANGNGVVDGVAELFGSANVDGYDELETLDANADGRIDAADPLFAELLVWRDLNADGVSTPDELLTLAQAGITRFNLAYTQTDSWLAGNIVARTGSYTRADGSSRTMGSLQFALDEGGNLPVVPDGAAAANLHVLPNLPGLNALPSLKTAMHFDPTLKAMVEELVHGDHDFETFLDFQLGGFLDILYRWAGVDTSIPLEPGDHPYYVQGLAAFMGRPFEQLNSHQLERLEGVWPDLVKALGIQFLIQAANNPRLEPMQDLAQAVAALDPDDPAYLDTVTTLTEAAVLEAAAIAPAYDYLEPFALLALDPASGEVSGDFNAVAALIQEDQPSYHWVTMGGGVHPWFAWYQEQGSLLFYIGDAMGFGRDYVLNITGWRWFGADVPEVQGTSGNDLIDAAGAADQRIFGNEGDDELRGNGGVDSLIGGTDNDLLKGGSGSDMYVYASGDGLDRIEDQSGTDDTIFFSNEYDAADLRVARIAGTNDLQLHFGNLAEGIVLAGQWGSAAAAIEHFQFVGEAGLHAADIATMYLATFSTAGNDTITGSWAGESISGLDGNDTLSGVAGDDELRGGAGTDVLHGGDGGDLLLGGDGNDTLYGNVGDDRLAGGLGNDTMQGGSEVDTYVYNLGDGDDIIYDASYDHSPNETLIFGAGITPDMLRFTIAGDWDDIRISFAGHAGSILLDEQNQDRGIEIFVFGDGTVWTEAMFYAAVVDAQQSAGNDVVVGTEWGDVIEGGGGDDALYGTRGNDTLIGGAGNDRLEGSSEVDTYVYNLGDGDDVIYDSSYDTSAAETLIFGAGIIAGTLIFSRVTADYDDIRISFAGHAGSIILDEQNQNAGIEKIQFADGTVWNKATLHARYVLDQQSALDDAIWGTESADSVDGGAGNDIVTSGAGNDTLRGGLGNDTLQGGSDVDTYLYDVGDGDDILYDTSYDTSPDETLRFGAGIVASDLIFTRSTTDSDDLIITFQSMAGRIVLDEQYRSNAGIEIIRFADGTMLTEAQFMI